jgi:ABC-type Fe3+-siderophore transport system permease subunit
MQSDVTIRERQKLGETQQAGAVEISVQGAIAGAMGAGAIALFFLVLDSVLRQPFYSPSLLGTVLFEGGLPKAFVPSLQYVGAYSWVHGMVFMAFGLAAAHALHRLGLHPASLASFVLVGLGLEAGFAGATQLIDPEIALALGHEWGEDLRRVFHQPADGAD